MTDRISQFQSASKDFFETISSFPAAKREEIIFDKWSLKDVIAHLVGWDEHFIEELDNLINNKIEKSIWVTIPNLNKNSTAKFKNDSYQNVIKTYQQTSQKLINKLRNLDKIYWDKPLFPEKKSRTPQKYLSIWIQHVTDHLQTIKSLKIV
ncbi:MAG: ClbS/DfsB family four-helix bundle protein [Candidatus Shapirobacteria bacterium]|jgi:uncharacterized damage-inducible protein DinB